ncbi:MAG: imidazoleglycerol-phosphate dehydratase [Candidatus Omnitrophota bacterium]
MGKGKSLRKITIKRKTRETEIECILNIDGKGESQLDTGIGFLDHMLELFVFHGLFELKLNAKGDLKVDSHHTNEDIGIVLGQAFKGALAKKRGIKRFGFAMVPMENVLASVILDIGGRGYFEGIRKDSLKLIEKKEAYTLEEANHFFESFAQHSGTNLIIKLELPGRNPIVDIHTGLEPVFKAWAIALSQAASIDPRRTGVPSTKGIID